MVHPPDLAAQVRGIHSLAELRSLLTQEYAKRPVEEFTKTLEWSFLLVDPSKLKVIMATESHICGKKLEGSSIGYSCRTCNIDSSAIFCNSCYEADKHAGHDVNISSYSGVCDCGDTTAITSSGFCSKHSGQSDDGAALDGQLKQMDPRSVHTIKNVFTAIFSECQGSTGRQRCVPLIKWISSLCRTSGLFRRIAFSAIAAVPSLLEDWILELPDATPSASTTQPDISNQRVARVPVPSVEEGMTDTSDGSDGNDDHDVEDDASDSDANDGNDSAGEEEMEDGDGEFFAMNIEGITDDDSDDASDDYDSSEVPAEDASNTPVEVLIELIYTLNLDRQFRSFFSHEFVRHYEALLRSCSGGRMKMDQSFLHVSVQIFTPPDVFPDMDWLCRTMLTASYRTLLIEPSSAVFRSEVVFQAIVDLSHFASQDAFFVSLVKDDDSDDTAFQRNNWWILPTSDLQAYSHARLFLSIFRYLQDAVVVERRDSDDDSALDAVYRGISYLDMLLNLAYGFNRFVEHADYDPKSTNVVHKFLKLTIMACIRGQVVTSDTVFQTMLYIQEFLGGLMSSSVVLQHFYEILRTLDPPMVRHLVVPATRLFRLCSEANRAGLWNRNHMHVIEQCRILEMPGLLRPMLALVALLSAVGSADPVNWKMIFNELRSIPLFCQNPDPSVSLNLLIDALFVVGCMLTLDSRVMVSGDQAIWIQESIFHFMALQKRNRTDFKHSELVQSFYFRKHIPDDVLKTVCVRRGRGTYGVRDDLLHMTNPFFFPFSTFFDDSSNYDMSFLKNSVPTRSMLLRMYDLRYIVREMDAVAAEVHSHSNVSSVNGKRCLTVCTWINHVCAGFDDSVGSSSTVAVSSSVPNSETPVPSNSKDRARLKREAMLAKMSEKREKFEHSSPSLPLIDDVADAAGSSQELSCVVCRNPVLADSCGYICNTVVSPSAPSSDHLLPVFVNCCGHVVHEECSASIQSNRAEIISAGTRVFRCPACRRLSNSVLHHRNCRDPSNEVNQMVLKYEECHRRWKAATTVVDACSTYPSTLVLPLLRTPWSFLFSHALSFAVHNNVDSGFVASLRILATNLAAFYTSAPGSTSVGLMPLSFESIMTDIYSFLPGKHNDQSSFSYGDFDRIVLMSLFFLLVVAPAKSIPAERRSEELFRVLAVCPWGGGVPNAHLRLIIHACAGILQSDADFSGESFRALIVGQLSPSMRLLTLPTDFREVFQKSLTEKCVRCNKCSKSLAQCLICGCLVCVASDCCKADYFSVTTSWGTDRLFVIASYSGVMSIGEARFHAEQHHAGHGIFLCLRSSKTLLLRPDAGGYIPSLYLDPHGEEDTGFRRGLPLYLNQQRALEYSDAFFSGRLGYEPQFLESLTSVMGVIF
eukprot:ANDGO_05780.mRNA.1 E3 ubiquitin-protein ligase ubr1